MKASLCLQTYDSIPNQTAITYIRPLYYTAITKSPNETQNAFNKISITTLTWQEKITR